MQAAVVTKPPLGIIKPTGTEKIFVGIDLHKKFLQVAAVDEQLSEMYPKSEIRWAVWAGV